jgi:formylglycine-generating enzyme required for sulfatase activity
MMREFAIDSELPGYSQIDPRDRIALLVGNADYPGQKLGTPLHDVEVLRSVLEDLRFDVSVVKNTTKREFETALAQFGNRINTTAPTALSFFYFAGHGVQHDTTNYLLPIDITDLRSPRHLPGRAVRVDDVVEQITGSNSRENIIVLDACRDNPLGSIRFRRAEQGLSRLLTPPPGTLIAFSTASGAVAGDGDGSNSPYLEALADELLQSSADATIGDVFHEVSKQVQRRTEHAQSPALYFQGHLETTLRPWTPTVPIPIADTTRSFVGVTVGTGDEGGVTRAIIPGAGKNQWFKDFESGPEMVIVPPGTFLMGGYASDQVPVHTVTIVEPFAVSRFAVTVAQFSAFVKESGYSPVDKISTQEALFDIGTYDVLSGPSPRQRSDRSFRRPGFPQAPDHPVVGINRYDAKKYVEWLSAKTAKPYRLLSEAEWEYAARAGSTTRFCWGDQMARRQANYDFHPGERRGKLSWWLRQKLTFRPAWGLGTGPVDIGEPNKWGLFNVHGNVDEWVEDAWHANYVGAPSDGSAWLDSDEVWGVVRGGAWRDRSEYNLASSARKYCPAVRGDNWTGFRVARTLRQPRSAR